MVTVSEKEPEEAVDVGHCAELRGIDEGMHDCLHYIIIIISYIE